VQLQFADRRRLVFATIITIVALPTLWLTGRDQATDASMAPVAVAVGNGAPVFMVGPTTPPVASVDIASPTVPAEQPTGRATYRRWASDDVARLRAHPCQTMVAPLGTRITVTNVNNGRSVACVNVLLEPPPEGAVITLHTEALLAIGKLADAPLPVRLRW
jgi:hypothetical protein